MAAAELRDMTNSISPRTGSLLGNATSMLGSAKEAIKAISEAASGTETPAAKPAETAPTGKGRRGVSLDRYA